MEESIFQDKLLAKDDISRRKMNGAAIGRRVQN
jgi:hypothetical protein